jgi:hypothetical protein
MVKAAKRSLILVTVALLAFCLVEGVARMVLGLGTPPLSVVDPEIEYMFKPNQDVMRFGNRQLYNAYGMRNGDFLKKKPAGEYRILCFGDSVLNGGNLTDHSNLATTLLAERLVKNSGGAVVVGNISAGSWGPPNMLAYARRYGLFGANQVVVQLSSHDIGDVPTFDPLNPLTHPTRNPCCATWEGIARYGPRYVPALEFLFKPSNSEEDLQGPPSQEKLNQMELVAHESSLKALSGLYEMATAQGAGFLIVLHGEREEVETGVFKPGHDAFVKWAELHSVDVLNLGVAETEALEMGIDPYRDNDNIHISDAGQKLLADQLFDYFVEGF